MWRQWFTLISSTKVINTKNLNNVCTTNNTCGKSWLHNIKTEYNLLLYLFLHAFKNMKILNQFLTS